MLIEPHKHILKKPHGNKDIYKIIPGSYFLDMIKQKYLYFRRVDTYSDDLNDSALPNKDRILSQQSKFQYAPNISMSDYYDKCRSKSYACCFTTQISNYIWRHYCDNDPNAICIVFKSGQLIKYLNSTLSNSRLIINERVHHDFFWINYGLVKYIDYDDQYLLELLPNPTEYLYIKNRKYSKEKEFRISLSCLQYGHYVLPNGEELQFPESIKLEFDFTKKVVKRLEIRSNHNNNFIREIKQALGNNINIKIL
ncbi:TPA: DUF2971 domain-containing protein [Legionella pneumophila]|uniref:DUF2971 domain-containing protein n=1 Tax=Legionella pneumophila TaxID=446 RepID=A0AAN5R6H9_LEGPN|nr:MULTISPECIES: DUF2971 domain-containing protein [Legionella]APF03543.1 hypothetical protein BIZ52_09305 [Legionella pneumophila subsp. fraseri]MCK1870211.1 DUF2971 domain-containing protein [Legionella pneumophila]MDI2078953.1 DUF2971 domain-containing protein [Legionella pneumophila]MDW9140201.1 DUF2971 domain-containing protein [Legionella pneumophila]NSL17321.1 DUF2971 domain-containing protein [Legionella micdadei]